MKPSYLQLESQEFEERINRLYSFLSKCRLCARECGVDRFVEKGFCRSGIEVIVSSAFPHFGEEPPLVGRGGSGTIFLTNCNLRCVFCQNYEISHLGEGSPISLEGLAKVMLKLQGMGCHNINFVTPTHFTPQLIKAVKLASQLGLSVPIVWNCGGYESVEVIKLLDGIVDIYMPDFKYGDGDVALKYSKASNYFEVACKALKAMHDQVGDLVIEGGIATQGLLIRHLVLPNDLASSEKVLRFIAKELSLNSYVNIMAQYRPCYEAFGYKELARPITYKEYTRAIEIARDLGLHRGFRW